SSSPPATPPRACPPTSASSSTSSPWRTRGTPRPGTSARSGRACSTPSPRPSAPARRPPSPWPGRPSASSSEGRLPHPAYAICGVQFRQYRVRCPRTGRLGATMSKGGDATWRLTRHAPFALVLAVAVALAAGTAAGADPAAPNAALAAKAKALQAKLDAQHAEVERLAARLNAPADPAPRAEGERGAERLNPTDARRHRLQQSLARLEARQEAARRQLETAQQQFDEQVRATYMNGPQWLLGELVGGANPANAMRQLPMTKAALEARAAVIAEVRIRKDEVDSLNERAAAELAEADLVHRRQADERRP